MKLKFLGGDSGPNGSPRAYATERGTYVIQGYKVDDSEALSQLSIPSHETVVEIPAELLKYLPKG